MRRSALPLAFLAAVVALTVVNWRLSNRRHIPSHEERLLTTDTFAQIAHRVLPQTVNIYLTGVNPRMRDLSSQMLDEMLDGLDPRRGPSAPLLPPLDPDVFGRLDASGSGVIIRSDGHIVTNHHLFADVVSPEISVHLYDGRVFSGEDVEMVGSDRLTDLAVLRIRTDGLPPVDFGDSDRLNIGDWVVAVGNPLQLANTVTHGIVSAKYREAGQGILVDYLQTSAHIERGSSGGALMNIDGQLVGINTAIATETESWEGFGFALPSNTVRRVVDEIIAHGHVARGYIGVQFDSHEDALPGPMRRLLGYTGPGGVLLRGVEPSGPADLAGLEPRDIVTAVAGQPVSSGIDLLRTVAALPIGTVAEIEYWRGDMTTSDGRALRAELMIAERPTDGEIAQRTQPMRMAPAFQPDAVTLPGSGLDLRVEERRGGARIVVDGVEPGSPAAEAGFVKGDVIVRINGWAVRSATSFFAALRLQPEAVLNHDFLTEREGGSQVHLTLPAGRLALRPAPEITPQLPSSPEPGAPALPPGHPPIP